ncbi:hypothetical protein ACERIT_08340 [Halopenitus sp. H-Gu1]|uniref:hypothetical protein n=1 Tax=Halopenitus sp. H-Gu1 TaxID=3242697 RepID=UPI00359D6DE9
MARHQDAFVRETERVPHDSEQTFEGFNDKVTEDSVLSRPPEDSIATELKKPLLIALAKANRDRITESNALDGVDPDYFFDAVVCDVAENAVTLAGLNPTEQELEKYRALLLQVIHGLPTNQAVHEYVTAYSRRERAGLGLGDACGRSTYQKTKRALKDAGEYDAIVHAADIAVHVVFGWGISPPDSVQSRYELEFELGSSADDYSFDTRQFALCALVNDLLEIIVNNMELGREANKSRARKTLLGVVAHSALTDGGIGSYEKSAQHLYDVESALSGSRVYDLTGSLPRWEINEIFDDITYALLKYVSDAGCIPDDPVISYDLTDLQGLDTSSFGKRFRTADGRWRFASLACTDTELEFSLGLRLLKSESQRASVLKNLLRKLTDKIDPQLVMLDRGFDGVADMGACRAILEEGNWLICAQNDEWKSDNQAEFSRLREELEPGGTAVLRSAGYEDLNPPTQLFGYSGSTDGETLDPIRAFYSDMKLPTDKEDRDKLITYLNFVYNHRGKIETMFRLTKNAFAVGSQSDDERRTLFYYNLSVLFYNLYKIVNTVPAPPTGIELDVSQLELLTVVRNLAFSGPTQPPALTYLQDQWQSR